MNILPKVFVGKNVHDYDVKFNDPVKENDI